jgi:hypothetical protein
MSVVPDNGDSSLEEGPGRTGRTVQQVWSSLRVGMEAWRGKLNYFVYNKTLLTRSRRCGASGARQRSLLFGGRARADRANFATCVDFVTRKDGGLAR